LTALHQLMADANIPAMSLAVVEGWKIVRTFAAGGGVSEGTSFQVCCLGKPVTAAAIQMLADEGRLRLDDPAARYLPPSYLPQPAGVSASITIRHLLTHQAGIIRGSFQPRFRDAADYATESHASDLAFAPGTQTKFSNLGYFLAGAILERVANRSVPEFLGERIFRPLGMTSATFDRPASAPAGHSRGEYYALIHRDDPLQPAPFFPLPAASGGFYCTAADYARFLAAGSTPLHQTGSNSGSSGLAFRDPARGVAAVAFCNRANASHELARALDVRDPGASPGCFAGEFSGVSDLLRLRPNGRGLYAELGPVRFDLRRRGAKSFLCESGPLREYLLRFALRDGRARTCSAGPHYFSEDGPPRAVPAPQIAGRYIYPRYATAEIFARHGRLYCQCGPLHESRLVPVAPDRYVEHGGLFDRETLRVLRRAAGRIAGIEMGGMTFTRLEDS
jgi:CubicO group peptidase (beta-lactamase class C family)